MGWSLLRGKGVRGGVAAVALAGLALPALAGAALAFGCVGAQERAALDVRALQTRLMVAALSCDARGDYNAFVRKYQRDLAGHGKTLKAHFRQAYGRADDRRLDAYVTALANEVSAESLVDLPGYCARARDLFAELRDGTGGLVTASAIVAVREADPRVCEAGSPALGAQAQR